jgi:hypothetical protein
VVGKLGCERVVYIVASVYNQSCNLGTKPYDLVMIEVLLSDCGSTEPLRTSSLMVTERINPASSSTIYLSEVKSPGAAIDKTAMFWEP